jgi:hypothetical protein
MKFVLFFIENEWAFGQIHHALIKRLWDHKIFSHLLDWNKQYNLREFRNITSKFDVIVTTPCRIALLVNQYGVPLNKIVAIAHHLKDIYWGVQYAGIDCFEQLHGYAVNHESLISGSIGYGVKRIPDIVTYGIDFDFYYAKPSKSLKMLGYAGAFAQTDVTGKECKRMHLAKLVSEKTAIPISASVTQNERLHFLAMPEFYKSVDCLLVPSTYETAGLPALEAAAAGRLVLSTQVGYFDGSFGNLCSMEDDNFVKDAVSHIYLHRTNPRYYRDACNESQQYVKEKFDWPVTINGWINAIK